MKICSSTSDFDSNESERGAPHFERGQKERADVEAEADRRGGFNDVDSRVAAGANLTYTEAEKWVVGRDGASSRSHPDHADLQASSVSSDTPSSAAHPPILLHHGRRRPPPTNNIRPLYLILITNYLQFLSHFFFFPHPLNFK